VQITLEQQMRWLVGGVQDAPVEVLPGSAEQPRLTYFAVGPAKIVVGHAWVRRFMRGRISWKTIACLAARVPVQRRAAVRWYVFSRPRSMQFPYYNEHATFGPAVEVQVEWLRKYMPQCWSTFIADVVCRRITISLEE
jgi:hypothetical protein